MLFVSCGTMMSPSSKPMTSSASVLIAWLVQVQKTSACQACIISGRHHIIFLQFAEKSLPAVTSTLVRDMFCIYADQRILIEQV